jgi:hypothetical protein
MTVRTRRILTGAAATYAALWLLPAILAPRTIELQIQARLERRWATSLHRAPSLQAGRSAYPFFTAHSFTPLPFLVRIDYSSGVMPLSEEGNRAWFVWVLGWTRQLGSNPPWVS